MGISKRLNLRNILIRGGGRAGRAGSLPVSVRDNFHVDFSMFLNSRDLGDRIDAKFLTVLKKTGGFTRQAMKRSMRKARKPKGFITTQTSSGQTVIIRSDGIVRDERGRAISRERAGRVLASLSPRQWKQIDTGGSKPGEPPRWRTKLLRDHILFGIGEDELSVLTGPRKLSHSRGTVSTPKLLNEGGFQRITLPNHAEVRARYLPRPFATVDSPAGKAGAKRFLELTGHVPL